MYQNKHLWVLTGPCLLLAALLLSSTPLSANCTFDTTEEHFTNIKHSALVSSVHRDFSTETGDAGVNGKVISGTLVDGSTFIVKYWDCQHVGVYAALLSYDSADAGTKSRLEGLASLILEPHGRQRLQQALDDAGQSPADASQQLSPPTNTTPHWISDTYYSEFYYRITSTEGFQMVEIKAINNL